MPSKNQAIVYSSIISLVWGMATAYILFANDVLTSWWRAMFIGLGLAFLNPIIGKIVVSIALLLCNAVDFVFDLPERKPDMFGKVKEGLRWGNWSSSIQILYAALWPVTGPIIITMSLTALIFGVLFFSLFRANNSGSDNKSTRK